MSLKIEFKAYVESISRVRSIVGENLVKLELMEERELPPTVIVQSGSSETSALVRDVATVLQQVMSNLPIGIPRRISIPRIVIWLTEDEWERLHPKPSIGDEVKVVMEKNKMIINFLSEG